MMKRLFIGVPVKSENTVDTAETWQHHELLRPNVLKWVRPENWHITLIFLGDTPESKVDLLIQLIEESFSNISAFSTELTGVGVFPNFHNPKVLWLGLDDLQPLIPARTHLGEMLLQHGFSSDNKPLKPHLTLARIRNHQHRTFFEPLLNQYQSSAFGSVEIDQVVLYESILTPQGPVYKPLFVKELLKG